MVDEISSIFKNGFQDLINDKGPREQDPYIFLLFNCPQHFFKRYCDKDFNIIDFQGLNTSDLVEPEFNRILEMSNGFIYLNAGIELQKNENKK